ncbi:MAG: TIGR04053 family radical SAM/SPASM domain-containing protein [Planctomycetaceae bacterium]|nr:TIGR04053 family radical SAM/SPASM domain-containing protein [Planctomycetaceae bacterium]
MIKPTTTLTRPAALPPRRDFNTSPLLVFYEFTRACDLVCQHCRACAQSAPDPDELSFSESCTLVDQLAQFPDPPMLVLTGGDPLKRADIYDLVEHGVALGLEVSITPSATPLVTRDAIARLRDCGISRLAVSIDGADAATHDAVRGVPGSLARSLQILADARELGVPTQVNTTLTPGNVMQIEVLSDLLATQGIVLWSVFFLVPVGRAEELPRLNAVQSEAAFERLWRQSQRQPYAIKTTEAPHYRRFSLQHANAGRDGRRSTSRPAATSLGVNDGRGVMFINHRGLMMPSGFLPIVCGVFPQDDPVQVYQRAPVFRALRDVSRLEGKCGDCEFRRVCGGSRARAFAVTGRLFAPEPDCVYQPPVSRH